VKNIVALLLLVFLDQISKELAIANFDYRMNSSVSLDIVQISNTAIVFGAGFIQILLVFFVFKWRSVPIKRIGLTLILSGALSNTIDRIFRGGVIDFIKISPFSVFNFADILIILGIIVLLIKYIHEEKIISWEK